MKYQLIALSDSDPAWNEKVESWWNNGGALLWNLYGGLGTESLILSQAELESFLAKANQVRDWDASDGPAATGEPLHPVSIQPYVEHDPAKPAQEAQSSPESPSLCCRDCGRAVHVALRSVWDRRVVMVPRTEMNHLLNSIQEAIAFARGNGPNNGRIWENALEELIESMGPLSLSHRNADED